ncbi:MAG: hypothetical protein ABH869_03515 [Candidatus Omnitrophota bacterium]
MKKNKTFCCVGITAVLIILCSQGYTFAAEEAKPKVSEKADLEITAFNIDAQPVDAKAVLDLIAGEHVVVVEVKNNGPFKLRQCEVEITIDGNPSGSGILNLNEEDEGLFSFTTNFYEGTRDLEAKVSPYGQAIDPKPENDKVSGKINVKVKEKPKKGVPVKADLEITEFTIDGKALQEKKALELIGDEYGFHLKVKNNGPGTTDRFDFKILMDGNIMEAAAINFNEDAIGEFYFTGNISEGIKDIEVSVYLPEDGQDTKMENNKVSGKVSVKRKEIKKEEPVKADLEITVFTADGKVIGGKTEPVLSAGEHILNVKIKNKGPGKVSYAAIRIDQEGMEISSTVTNFNEDGIGDYNITLNFNAGKYNLRAEVMHSEGDIDTDETNNVLTGDITVK